MTLSLTERELIFSLRRSHVAVVRHREYKTRRSSTIVVCDRCSETWPCRVIQLVWYISGKGGPVPKKEKKLTNPAGEQTSTETATPGQPGLPLPLTVDLQELAQIVFDYGRYDRGSSQLMLREVPQTKARFIAQFFDGQMHMRSVNVVDVYLSDTQTRRAVDIIGGAFMKAFLLARAEGRM